MAHISAKRRNHIIITASLVGVLANFLLALFKAIVGFMSGSIAVVLDAANSFSDMLASIVTIVGVKIANRAPDRHHPMGHGRFEYIGSAIIAMIIFYIGMTALFESFGKIIHPTEIDYSPLSILVIIVAIITKLFLALYFKRVSKKVDSDSLKGSGVDALLDSLVSASTLVAALILILFDVSIEPYLALAISGLIIFSSIKMLRESFSTIVGERVDSELAKGIKKEINSIEGVMGAYDLMIHNYGSHMNYASVNIEVKDSLDALEIDDISREIRRKIKRRFHILVTSVGIYPINTRSAKATEMQKQIHAMLAMNDNVIQMHGFHVDEKLKEVSFDVVLDFNLKNRYSFKSRLIDELEEVFPGYQFVVTIDPDICD